MIKGFVFQKTKRFVFVANESQKVYNKGVADKFSTIRNSKKETTEGV